MKPTNGLLLTELPRALTELVSLSLATHLKNTPNGIGRPLLFIPGFTAGDYSTYIARRFFEKRGYITSGWEQGSNLGPFEKAMTGLENVFHGMVDCCSEPVTLIGHSLGGIYARELAKSYPNAVRSVITLGTPINEPEGATHLANLFRYLNPHTAITEELHHAPDVPTTIIYTEEDGIVHYSACIQPNPPHNVTSVVVSGSHTGMIVNPIVFDVMLEALTNT